MNQLARKLRCASPRRNSYRTFEPQWHFEPRHAVTWRTVILSDPVSRSRSSRRNWRDYVLVHRANDESLLCRVQPVELLLQLVTVHLDPRQAERLELRRIRARRTRAGYLQYCVERIRHLASGFRIAPAARLRELTVLRPDAKRQRERPHFVARHRGVDRHHATRNLFLHHGVAVLRKIRVPQRV